MDKEYLEAELEFRFMEAEKAQGILSQPEPSPAEILSQASRLAAHDVASLADQWMDEVASSHLGLQERVRALEATLNELNPRLHQTEMALVEARREVDEWSVWGSHNDQRHDAARTLLQRDHEAQLRVLLDLLHQQQTTSATSPSCAVALSSAAVAVDGDGAGQSLAHHHSWEPAGGVKDPPVESQQTGLRRGERPVESRMEAEDSGGPSAPSSSEVVGRFPVVGCLPADFSGETSRGACAAGERGSEQHGVAAQGRAGAPQVGSVADVWPKLGAGDDSTNGGGLGTREEGGLGRPRPAGAREVDRAAGGDKAERGEEEQRGRGKEQLGLAHQADASSAASPPPLSQSAATGPRACCNQPAAALGAEAPKHAASAAACLDGHHHSPSPHEACSAKFPVPPDASFQVLPPSLLSSPSPRPDPRRLNLASACHARSKSCFQSRSIRSGLRCTLLSHLQVARVLRSALARSGKGSAAALERRLMACGSRGRGACGRRSGPAESWTRLRRKSRGVCRTMSGPS